MSHPVKSLLILALLVLIPWSCRPQTRKDTDRSASQQTDRKPVVAGSFYPADPGELRRQLTRMFQQAKPPVVHGEVFAILAPHAGYVFSGSVAASSYNQLNKDMEYENIFVIGSSHRVGFDGASIYNKGHYITPLGTVTVNTGLANTLIDEHPCFTHNPAAHSQEHSLEVQLPFLQYHLSKEFQIVPIVIGTQDPLTCRKIAQALRPFFTPRNLFVISTDFSHYPGYDEAVKVDKLTASAVLANSPGQLLKTLQQNAQKDIPGLVTSLCGWSAVLTLLYLTENRPDIEIVPIDYKNSGDSEYGDKSQVVGYHAICVTLKERGPDSFHLDEKDSEILLQIATEAIEEYVRHQKIRELDTREYSKTLLLPAGAFVSLYKDGILRGCIGQFEPVNPLCQVVRDVAISSSVKDYRFFPVTPEELEELEVEISVLSPLRKIRSLDEIILGKHGIYISKGNYSGTFLPQVATQTGWTLEQFLGHCARDKAGIGWDGWRDADIYVYEAFVFGKK